MKRLFFLFTLLVPGWLGAQTDANRFPHTWVGHWAGELEIYGSKGKNLSLPMELTIAPADSAGRWAFTVIYHGEADDVRAYELVEKNAAEGAWVIDEKNSILLDCYYFEGVLTSAFSVDGTHLTVNYAKHKKAIVMEIFISSLRKGVVTGEAVEEVEEIMSYPMSGRHYARLTPVKARGKK